MAETNHRRLRIGLIANSLQYEAGINSGGLVHFMEVLKRWSDVELVVFAPKQARAAIAASLPMAGFRALPSLTLNSASQLGLLYRSIMALTARAALRKCDVLLAVSHFLPDIAPLVFAQPCTAVAVVFHVVGSTRPDGLVPRTIGIVAERVSIELAKLVCTGFIIQNELTARVYGFRKAKKPLMLTANAADHMAITPDEVCAYRRSGAIFCGRLDPSKGLDDLLMAWAQVTREVPAKTLTIIGDGSEAYKQHLEQLARSLGISKTIRFAGKLSDSDKKKELLSSEIFTFPSKLEGWGIAIAEAMSARLPCVLYDLAVYSEFFTAGNVRVPVGDVNAYAKETIRLFKDAQERERLALNGWTLSRRFTWDVVAQQERRFMDRVARSKHTRQRQCS